MDICIYRYFRTFHGQMQRYKQPVHAIQYIILYSYLTFTFIRYMTNGRGKWRIENARTWCQQQVISETPSQSLLKQQLKLVACIFFYCFIYIVCHIRFICGILLALDKQAGRNDRADEKALFMGKWFNVKMKRNQN